MVSLVAIFDRLMKTFLNIILRTFYTETVMTVHSKKLFIGKVMK